MDGMKQYISWKVVGYVAGAIGLVGLAWYFMKKPKLTPEQQKKKDDEAAAKKLAQKAADDAKKANAPKLVAPFQGFVMMDN